jgi:hypothetical protein
MTERRQMDKATLERSEDYVAFEKLMLDIAAHHADRALIEAKDAEIERLKNDVNHWRDQSAHHERAQKHHLQLHTRALTEAARYREALSTIYTTSNDPHVRHIARAALSEPAVEARADESVLLDLRVRMAKARAEIHVMADNAMLNGTGDDERLNGKAQGVALCLSYLDDAIRLSPPSTESEGAE